MMKIVKKLTKSSLIAVSNQCKPVWKLARFVSDNTTAHSAEDYNRYTYDRLRDRFIANGRGSRYDEDVRRRLVARFERIDRNVEIASTPTDGLFLAEALFNTTAPGDIVECGCFNGGSSAKLSILADLAGRKLLIFDSFEGLPIDQQNQSGDLNLSKSIKPNWHAGRYAAALDLVRANIERYGNLSPCSFVRGWFKDTLIDANLPSRVAFAFTDVDLASSARDCIVGLWPKMDEGAVYFTHDTGFIKVLETYYDQDLWTNVLKDWPPVLFGAGYGLCPESPHLGYFVKGRSFSPEYLKSLTIYR